MTTERTDVINKISYSILWAIIIAEVVFLYKDIFSWMNMAWFTYPPDRFGPYVPVIFLGMFAYCISKKTDIAFNSSSFGLPIILAGIIVFLTGHAADIHIIQAFSIILTCFGLVTYMMGIEWGRILLFPFFFLILMLPTVSFLLESTFGVFFRNAITFVSGIILNVTGGEWKMDRGVLFLSEIDLPIKYYRHSISSPLALLIQVFIAAELIFIKNRYKFLFTALFFIPLVVAVHSIHTIFMGWTFDHDYMKLSESVWNSREWLPAIFQASMLIVIGVTVKLGRFFRENKR